MFFFSVKTELSHDVLKKARVSRIMSKPEDGDILEKVSNIHKNIKSLQILSNETHTCNMM